MNKNSIVIFGNGTEWLKYSLHDMIQSEATLIQGTEVFKNIIANKLLRTHFSIRLNSKFDIPLKKLWYRKICKAISFYLTSKCPVIIFYDWNVLAYDFKLLSYLRNYFKDLKLVYIFTNISKISGANKSNKIDLLSKNYDVVYAFDPSDSRKYGFHYFPLIYSRFDIENYNDLENKSDVFYIGNAKDRLDMLHRAFGNLKDFDLKQDFHIVGVPEDKEIFRDEISYNKPMSYFEVLKHINNTSCLLDVIQSNSEGYTIKVCEAIYYNKLLITTNQNIVNAPFYKSEYIKVIDVNFFVDRTFFDKAESVHYSESDKYYFSSTRFLEKMKKDLNIN